MKGLGTQVRLSMIFILKWMAKWSVPSTLEDMLSDCVINFKGNWDDHLPLIEISYDTNIIRVFIWHHFKYSLVGIICIKWVVWCRWLFTPLSRDNLWGHGKCWMIRDRFEKAYIRQKTYVDDRKRDLEFHVDDWFYFKISPMKGVMRFGKKRNLVPSMWPLWDIEVGRESYLWVKIIKWISPCSPGISSLYTREIYRRPDILWLNWRVRAELKPFLSRCFSWDPW